MPGVIKVSPNMTIGDGVSNVTFDAATISLTFTFAAGSTTTINVLPLVANLIADAEGTIVTALVAARAGIAIINPAIGAEKNGDIRIANNIGYIRSNDDWKQVWPTS